MPRSRKSTTTPELTKDTLPGIVEQVASKAGQSITVTVTSEPRALKSHTDRIRRLPRLKGWNAVTVKIGERDEAKGTVTMTITASAGAATPWPKQDKAPVAKAKTPKAVQQVKEKADSRPEQRLAKPRLPKATTKRAAKAAPAKAAAKSAVVPGVSAVGR